MLFSQIRQYVKGILANSFINKSTLDKLGENNNGLTFNGNNIESPQELTSQQMQDIKDAFSGMNKGAPLRMMHYSTEEQVVGTWIDKRPIYQKTAQVTLPSVSVQTWTNVGFSLGNNISFAKIVGAEVSSNDPGYGFIPLSYLNMIAVKVAYDGNIQIYESSNASWANILYITVQYTKTTDTPQ